MQVNAKSLYNDHLYEKKYQAFFQMYVQSQLSLKNKGLYLIRNLQRIQQDYNSKISKENLQNSNILLQYTRNMRQIVSCYEIMVNQIKETCILIDLADFGKCLSKLFQAIISQNTILFSIITRQSNEKPKISMNDFQQGNISKLSLRFQQIKTQKDVKELKLQVAQQPIRRKNVINEIENVCHTLQRKSLEIDALISNLDKLPKIKQILSATEINDLIADKMLSNAKSKEIILNYLKNYFKHTQTKNQQTQTDSFTLKQQKCLGLMSKVYGISLNNYKDTVNDLAFSIPSQLINLIQENAILKNQKSKLQIERFQTQKKLTMHERNFIIYAKQRNKSQINPYKVISVKQNLDTSAKFKSCSTTVISQIHKKSTKREKNMNSKIQTNHKTNVIASQLPLATTNIQLYKKEPKFNKIKGKFENKGQSLKKVRYKLSKKRLYNQNNQKNYKLQQIPKEDDQYQHFNWLSLNKGIMSSTAPQTNSFNNFQ